MQNVNEKDFWNLTSERNIFSGEHEESKDDLFRPASQDKQYYIATLYKEKARPFDETFSCAFLYWGFCRITNSFAPWSRDVI